MRRASPLWLRLLVALPLLAVALLGGRAAGLAGAPTAQAAPAPASDAMPYPSEQQPTSSGSTGSGSGGSDPSATTPATPGRTVAPIRFGIGDQHAAMFSDPRWKALGLKTTRYNVPWNAAEDPQQRANAVAFATAARAAGVQVLMHLTGRIIDGVLEPLPTRTGYAREARKLIALMRPLGVTTWGAWNEANHSSQPTVKHPERAAQYFLELRAACPGCTIVAADVLTQGGPHSDGFASYRGWLRRYFAALGTKRALVRLVGIHNYGELTERFGAVKSRDLIQLVRRYAPKARFWITESGGLAASRTRVCSEARQVTGTYRMFSQAVSLARWGVDRLYMYNWTAKDCDDSFDSGLIRDDGTARPALNALRVGARTVAR